MVANHPVPRLRRGLAPLLQYPLLSKEPLPKLRPESGEGGGEPAVASRSGPNTVGLWGECGWRWLCEPVPDHGLRGLPERGLAPSMPLPLPPWRLSAERGELSRLRLPSRPRRVSEPELRGAMR